MQAVFLTEKGGVPTYGELPVPQPGPGEVLIRMAVAPINPSDIGFLKGSYEQKKPFPLVPGFEGSGTVVAVGAGLLPRLVLGKRVGCAVSATGGTWAEYLVTKAALCVPLPKNLTFEQGSMMMVNPLTALAFFDMVKRGRHAAVINTAAASALGRMILRLGLSAQVPVINIVRRPEQIQLLRSVGAQFVLSTSEPNFLTELQRLSHTLNATLILDAVGGELFRQLVDVTPIGSTIMVYGNLSGEQHSFQPSALWKEDKRIAGFFLGTWAAKQNLIHLLRAMQTVKRLAATDLQTFVQQRLPLSKAQEAIDMYQKNMTAGKILLVTDPESIRT